MIVYIHFCLFCKTKICYVIFFSDEIQEYEIISTAKTDSSISLQWGETNRLDLTFYFIRQGTTAAIPLTSNEYTFTNLYPATEFTFTLQPLLANPPAVDPVTVSFKTCKLDHF